MIPKKFVAPNYRLRVGKHGGGAEWRLDQGASAAEVRQKWEARNRTVLAVEDYDFQAWVDEAQLETGRAVAAKQAGQPYEFDDGIWSELKDYLFRLFDEKCAYCEGSRGAVTSGAVEHYRPKSGVQDDAAHPGYYWLAYLHTNYLPACPDCNSKKGKRFPVANPVQRARLPADPLAAEGAYLFHPYLDDPSAEFDYKVIWEPNSNRAMLIHAQPKSPRAEQSIKIVGLDRERLPEERAVAQHGALLRFMSDLRASPNPELAALRAGKGDYSAACLKALLEMITTRL
jgi:hypothetical protein